MSMFGLHVLETLEPLSFKKKTARLFVFKA